MQVCMSRWIGEHASLYGSFCAAMQATISVYIRVYLYVHFHVNVLSARDGVCAYLCDMYGEETGVLSTSKPFLLVPSAPKSW